jgi:hypothetical protein
MELAAQVVPEVGPWRPRARPSLEAGQGKPIDFHKKMPEAALPLLADRRCSRNSRSLQPLPLIGVVGIGACVLRSAWK